MTFRLRYALPLVCAGILGAGFLLAMQSHAHAGNRQLSYSAPEQDSEAHHLGDAGQCDRRAVFNVVRPPGADR